MKTVKVRSTALNPEKNTIKGLVRYPAREIAMVTGCLRKIRAKLKSEEKNNIGRIGITNQRIDDILATAKYMLMKGDRF